MIVVLDTSVLIAFFDGEDAHHTDSHRLLAGVAGEDLVASSMTLAELLVGPARQSRDAVASTLDALTRLAIREVQFPEDVAVRLAGLRASTGLKMPDCCVVLAAETAGRIRWPLSMSGLRRRPGSTVSTRGGYRNDGARVAVWMRRSARIGR